MPARSSKPGSHAEPEQSCGRPLTVVELLLVLEELDRVVNELEASLSELALPFDESSRRAARAAVAAAARRDA
jgi:hypothetical protein